MPGQGFHNRSIAEIRDELGAVEAVEASIRRRQACEALNAFISTDDEAGRP